MKFVVEKNALIKALSHVQSIVERKNTLPILSNILIEAKNLECQIITTEKDYFRLHNNNLHKFKIIKSELKIIDEDNFVKSLI